MSGPNGFWSSYGAVYLADPSAHYDDVTGRFWIIAIEVVDAETGYFYIAVSDDGDPNGVWNKYQISTAVITPTGPYATFDYPTLDMDSSVVYAIAHFAGAPYVGCLSIDKAHMLNNGSNPPPHTLFRYFPPLPYSKWWCIATSYGTPPTTPYFVECDDSPANSAASIRLWAKNSLGQLAPFLSYDIAVPCYRTPGQPVDKGNASIDLGTGPAHTTRAMYINGDVWATHTITQGCDTPGARTFARYYRVRTNGWPFSGFTPTLVETGDIGSGAGTHHTYMASVGVSRLGHVAITYHRSAPGATGEFPSIYRIKRCAGGSFGPETLVWAGTESQSAMNVNRVGDYCNTEPDPARALYLWGHCDFMDDDDLPSAPPSPGQWMTRIARYYFECAGDWSEDGGVDAEDTLAIIDLYQQGDAWLDLDADGTVSNKDFVDAMLIQTIGDDE